MKVKGFWHVWLHNHWFSVVVDQIRILKNSGLYDASESISIGLIGSAEEVKKFNDYILSQYPKLQLEYMGSDPLEYEFPTLRLIEKDVSDYYGYYFHTKAVTNPFHTDINYWRHVLNEMVLNRWREHVEALDKGFDVSSITLMKEPAHFSGNFWWFNSRHIDRLPEINSLDLTYRWHAEQWICMARGRWNETYDMRKGEIVIIK